MRKNASLYIFLIFFTAFLSQTVASVADDNLPALDEVRVPDSPAFSLMEISPTSISKPATARAFMVNLLDAAKSSDKGIPKNVAIEFTPYWWQSRPKLTFEQYYFPKEEDKYDYIGRTTSISLGSAPAKMTVEGKEVDGTRIGLGLRFSLLQGKPSVKLKSKAEQINNVNALLKKILDSGKVRGSIVYFQRRINKLQEGSASNFTDLSPRIKEELLNSTEYKELLSSIKLVNNSKLNITLKEFDALPKTNSKINDQDNKDVLDNSLNEINKALDSIWNEINTYTKDALIVEFRNQDKQRDGWQVDFAAARIWDVPGDKWENKENSRTGAWLTAAYHSSDGIVATGDFTFLGLGRYIYDYKKETGKELVDLGASLVWRHENDPVSISAEYIHRYASDRDSERFTGTMEYDVNEDYSVFVAYGKNFNEVAPGGTDLVTMAGIHMGFGKRPQDQLEKK